MSFETLLCAIIAVYGLLNFVVQPRLTKAWNASRTPAKVARAGLISAVQFVRDTAFVATLMYLAFAFLTGCLGFGFGHNASFLEWVVRSASHLHEWLESIQTYWSKWFFLFPLALLIYIHWRTQRNRFSGRFERLIDDELDRLNEERSRDPRQWTVVAPDESMRALDEQIAGAKERLAALAKRGPQDRTERRRLLRLVSELNEKRSEIDYERRVNLGKLNVPEEPPHSQPALQRILLSRGLFSDLQGFAKLVSRLTLAMLSLALIGVAGTAGLTQGVWNRIIHLDDLRVQARTDEAEKLWKAHTPGTEKAPLSDSDRQAIQHLSNDFARALSQNPHWISPRSAIRVDAAFEQRIGRRAILSRVQLPDADGQTREAFAHGLSDAETEILNDIASGRANESRVGRIISEQHGVEIKSWFGDRWGGVKNAIIEHAKTYHQPVGMDDLQGQLIDRVVAVAFDVSESDEASNILKQARDGISDATKEAARTAVETELHRVMEDLGGGKPYGETIEKVRKAEISISKAKVEDLAAMIQERKLPDARDFADRLAKNPGNWKNPDRPSPPGGGGGASGGAPESAGEARNNRPEPLRGGASESANDIVSDIASKATRNGEYSLPSEDVGALAEYEDHFPRSVASQADTTLGKTLARYRIAADAEEFAQIAALNVERAASFSMLRGFSKVGGVLIGKEPQGSADIRDIRWSIIGRGVTIVLIDADGRASSFGPFDQSLVHQSLAYAADGRPVAVTMTIARPVQGLKIFLHPSLVDTPLGCRVQELDRLVDTYALEQLPDRARITDQYYAQVAVYNVALAKRREAIAEKANWAELKQSAASILLKYGSMAGPGLRQYSLFADSSILRRKPEFFDPSLIKTAKSCQKPDLDGFETCVLETYRSSRAIREFKKDELKTWLIGPTEMEPWSGVRERKYRIGNDLDFLRQPAGNPVEDRLWPFDFIVQIAFTSAAVNLPEKQQEKYVDRQPIEFDEIQSKIENLVKAGIEKDGFGVQFEDLRSFAILQRLFRAALNGNLGSHFPILKLAELTDSTKGAAPYFHTKRWNTSATVRIEMLVRRAALLQNNPAPWMKKAALKLPRCESSLARTLADSRDQSDLADCQFEEFRDVAGAACPENADERSPGCIWRSVVAGTGALPRIQKVEVAFGVLDDERQNHGGVDCPPLAPPTYLSVKR